MLSKVIRNFIAKRVAGRTDDGIMITLSDPKKVDFQAAMLEDLLMRNGIDPKLIQTEDQLKNIINQIKAAEAQATATSGIRGSQSAKVFDLEGKEIPPGSQIMGGKQVKNESGSLMSVPDKRGLAGMEYETDAAIKARLEGQNKDSVSRILERKNREDVYGLEDYDTTNMSDLQKEIIRTEAKLGNLNPDSPNFRERAKPLIDKIEELKNKMKGGENIAKDPDFIDGPFDNKAEKLAEIKMSNEGFIDDVINNINNMESITSMKEMNKVISKQGKYKNLTDQDVDKIFKATEDRTSGRLDEIDPDDYDPYQTGGRVGLKTGMSRRGFLKLMGGVGAGIGALKSGVLKMFGKEGAQQVTKEIVRTPNVPGKPEWFDSLVNKVITQGDDVSKNFATKERQVVHKLKIDDMEDVTVSRNLDDGEIRVSYDSPNNMGEQPVDLVFKPGKGQMDETTGKISDEFYAVESEPRGARMGPDDYEIEFDGENLVDNVDDLISDTSKLKQVATDKKQTLKEFVESKKKKDQTRALNKDQVEQAEYLETKYGPAPDEGDPNFQNFDMSEDFASGGRVGLFLGGGLTKGKGVVREFLKNLAKEKGISGSEMMKVINPKAYQKFLEDPSLYKKYNPKTGLMATDEVKKFMKETEVARGDQLERLIEMIKTRRGNDENIEEMIRNAVRETGAPREEIEPLIRTMISMKAGRTGEGIIPSNVSEEALLEMEQMLKNIRTRDRQMNAGGGLAYMLGE